MQPKPLPDAAYLRECFSYNQKTGTLRWKKRPPSHFKSFLSWRVSIGQYSGKVVGTTNHPDGYIRVTLDKRRVLAHRIIWILMTGEEPEQIDHHNGIRSDNRWSNLRNATNQKNSWNRHKRRNDALPQGVMQRSSGRFGAYYRNRVTDVQHCLGTFDTPEAAHAAWCAAVREERGEFFRAD